MRASTDDAGALPSSRSSFSKCFRAFLMLTRVAAEAAELEIDAAFKYHSCKELLGSCSQQGCLHREGARVTIIIIMILNTPLKVQMCTCGGLGRE